MVTKAANGTEGDNEDLYIRRKNKPHYIPRKGTFYTKEEVRKALLENNGLQYATARFLRISPHTMDNYLKKWPSLKKYTKQGREYLKDVAELTLLDAMENRKQDMNVAVKAAEYVLDRTGEDREFVKKSVNRIEGGIEPPKVPTKISEEDKKKLLEEVRKELPAPQVNIQNVNIGLKELPPEQVPSNPMPNPLPQLPGIVIDAEVVPPSIPEEDNFCI